MTKEKDRWIKVDDATQIFEVRPSLVEAKIKAALSALPIAERDKVARVSKGQGEMKTHLEVKQSFLMGLVEQGVLTQKEAKGVPEGNGWVERLIVRGGTADKLER